MNTKYNILVVASSGKFLDTVRKILSSVSSDNVEFCSKLSLSIDLSRRNYDFVIVDYKEDNLTDLLTLQKLLKTEILAIISEENKPKISELSKHGISVAVKPLSGEMLVQMYLLLCTSREKIKKLDNSLDIYKDKLDEIKLYDQAKLFLITKEGLTEDEAHRHIEKNAMEQRITKIDSAKQVLSQYGI